MTELRVSVDASDSPPADELLGELLAISSALDPAASIDSRHLYTMHEITIASASPSEEQADIFSDKLLGLSRTFGQTFTVVTTLDDVAFQVLAHKFPQLASSNEHVLHVRPTEESAARSYFRFMLGAP